MKCNTRHLQWHTEFLCLYSTAVEGPCTYAQGPTGITLKVYPLLISQVAKPSGRIGL